MICYGTADVYAFVENLNMDMRKNFSKDDDCGRRTTRVTMISCLAAIYEKIL